MLEIRRSLVLTALLFCSSIFAMQPGKPSVQYREAREAYFKTPSVQFGIKIGYVSKKVCAACAKATKALSAEIVPAPAAIKTVDFSGRVMLVFSSPGWCRYCKQMEPLLIKIAASRTNVHLIDPDNGPLAKAEAEKREVTAIPMYIIYQDGREVDRHTGVHAEAEIVGWLAN